MGRAMQSNNSRTSSAVSYIYIFAIALLLSIQCLAFICSIICFAFILCTVSFVACGIYLRDGYSYMKLGLLHVCIFVSLIAIIPTTVSTSSRKACSSKPVCTFITLFGSTHRNGVGTHFNEARLDQDLF